MLIRTRQYIINTDHIVSAVEDPKTGKTTITLINGKEIKLYTIEAEAIWSSVPTKLIAEDTQTQAKGMDEREGIKQFRTQ